MALTPTFNAPSRAIPFTVTPCPSEHVAPTPECPRCAWQRQHYNLMHLMRYARGTSLFAAWVGPL
jgi:hypothetical protein